MRPQVPLLLLSGAADELIPPAHMDRLYAAAPPTTRFRRFPGGGHMQTYMCDGYIETWRRFLAGIKESRPPQQSEAGGGP